MTEESKPDPIKIKRRRRRLYESAEQVDSTPESENQTDAGFTDTDFTDNQQQDASSIQVPVVKEASPGCGITRSDEAEKIVKKYAYWSAGAGLIPIPSVDFLAVTALEIKMIHQLCHIYEVEFSKQRVKAVIGALIGGWHTGLIAGSFLKSVPVLGLAITTVSVGAISGAITYGIGTVFNRHFESGGTLLDFSPGAYQGQFREAVEEGKQVV